MRIVKFKDGKYGIRRLDFYLFFWSWEYVDFSMCTGIYKENQSRLCIESWASYFLESCKLNNIEDVIKVYNWIKEKKAIKKDKGVIII